MGWPNSAHRPYEVIHNIKNAITGEKRPYTVASVPSFGETRIYAKEQALIDLVKAELAEKRPCVIYLRQTDTRDLQPRIEKLLRDHVPGAKPFILRNTVQAERREAVINAAVAQGCNLILCNPELTKTGLDLIFAPTIIFLEMIFNLGTMMQSAARSYRLNQTYKHCKVIYLFYENTMEHSAVQLMSRKQRAAKLLTGDIGLTGLDALTEGESGFEEALLNAIGRDDTLLNPSEMFKSSNSQTEIDAEDANYWNAAVVAEPEAITEDPLLVMAVEELGATIVPVAPRVLKRDDKRLIRYVGDYLDSVHLVSDNARRASLQAKLLVALTDGVQDDREMVKKVIGLNDPQFSVSPNHEETLIRWVRRWLKEHRFVFTGHEDEAAARIVALAKQALGLTPVQLDVFEALQEMRDE